MAGAESTADTLRDYPCDLCGLPVEGGDFELITTTGRKRFCCEGCFGIFQMLHEDEIVSTDSDA